MRTVSFRQSRHLLARSAAVLVIGGLAAGCSSGVSRFTGDILTGSIANQRSIVKKEDQPFPGDVAPAVASAPAPVYQPAEPAAGAVTRSTLPPAQPQVAAAPTSAPALDRAPTGAVEKPKPVQVASTPATEKSHQGWSSAGGTQVTLREGETLYNLSKRFGVPVASIMSANGIANADSVRSGQTVIIPTYVYSNQAGVSAPDAQKKVADASSSRGTKQAQPAGDLPQPGQKPDNNVAVLPQQPKLKEQAAAPANADTASAQGKAPEGNVYTVAAGDTLGGIAAKTGVKSSDIQKANGLTSSAVRIGQKLRIPAGGATVASTKRVDPVTTGTPGPSKTESRVATKAPDAAPLATYTPPKREDKAIKEAAAYAPEETPDATGIGKMRWPARGRVIGTFGNGNNDGIDIAVPEGTPVKAAENGVVIFAGEGLKDFGRTVLVRHSDGKVTVYGHASELKVKRGDTVKRGQEIARSGMSGNADSPKLHFEVRNNSEPVDPQQFLE